MVTCICGHGTEEHQDGGGRCTGQCIDGEYGRFNCVCPYYTTEDR